MPVFRTGLKLFERELPISLIPKPFRRDGDLEGSARVPRVHRDAATHFEDGSLQANPVNAKCRRSRARHSPEPKNIVDHARWIDTTSVVFDHHVIGIDLDRYS